MKTKKGKNEEGWTIFKNSKMCSHIPRDSVTPIISVTVSVRHTLTFTDHKIGGRMEISYLKILDFFTLLVEFSYNLCFVIYNTSLSLLLHYRTNNKENIHYIKSTWGICLVPARK